MRPLNVLLWCAATLALPLDTSGPTHPKSIHTLGRVQYLKSVTAPKRNTRFKGRQSSSLFDYKVNTLWLTEVTIGSQNLWVEIDTGSSEFWVVSTGYTCVANHNCEMGSAYTPDNSFTQIPDQNCNATYEDGSFVNGILGNSPVVFAGISIPLQEICVAEEVSYYGGNQISGLMGLSYSAGTTGYTGTNPSADGPNNYVASSSIMNTIFESDALTAPFFALAISRDESNTGYGGVLTIGELPDMTDPRVNASPDFVSALIEPGANAYTAYNINADISYGTQVLSASIAGPTQWLVDSGTTLLNLPAQDAAAFNALWQPPATPTGDIWMVECDATPPKLVVDISGSSFAINPLDLVRKVDGVCYSTVAGVRAGYGAILGTVFLRNVLAVYDWGGHMMQFAVRETYES